LIIRILRRCYSRTEALYSSPTLHPENDLSNLTLERIEHELQQINVNLAEANDIAMLTTYKAMPPELDNDSRKALAMLRDKMMKRARDRAML
jgi:hypothetical protein